MSRLRFKAVYLFAIVALPVYANPRAFITNQLDNSVSVIDTQSHRVIETIKVEGKPAGVAINPVLQQIYVSTPEGGGFAVLTATN